ncbi:MAG: hypothetical protein LUG19_05435 [Desulfovibrio sp.]|uniref:hypothetical protein n=1 Tax=Desulfovibrio sp. TaxID=885 RepID=UPI00258E75E9|nr:hypothetical protein [Desulfovibrio sp.]MCD7983682.1 hypothetical protein [Desulfovibrio sp.]
MKDLNPSFLRHIVQHAHVGKYDISQYPAKYKGALTKKEKYTAFGGRTLPRQSSRNSAGSPTAEAKGVQNRPRKDRPAAQNTAVRA